MMNKFFSLGAALTKKAGIVLVFSFALLFLSACQKQTLELADTSAPEDQPSYTLEPDVNRSGPQSLPETE